MRSERPSRVPRERGVALISVLLLTLALGAIVVGALLLTSQASLMGQYRQRYTMLEAAADEALAEALSQVNATNGLYPDSGYTTIANDVPVGDLRRSLYVGSGNAVAVVKDQMGNQVVRRLEIVAESFAKFASSNTEQVSQITMPTTTELTKLRIQAQAGNAAFISSGDGAAGEASMRIEFIAVDLNSDGLINGADEGFMRVYQVPSASVSWLSATRPPSATSNYLRNEDNCGHIDLGQFVTARGHPTTGPDSWNAALTSASRRCYLGGADALNAPDGFVAHDGKGSYLAWPGTVSPLLAARADRNYLFPLSRALNPTFKGVIYVEGKVMISGVVRGRVTVAATDNIIVGDDLTYATNPATGACADMVGLFSARDVVIADNLINGATRVSDATTGTYYTMDNTRDEFVHGIVLALNVFAVQNANADPNSSAAAGENLYLTGGVIQGTRGAGGLGSYDACAFSNPPPYFPTTGRFAQGHYFEIDPRGFNIDTFFTP